MAAPSSTLSSTSSSSSRLLSWLMWLLTSPVSPSDGYKQYHQQQHQQQHHNHTATSGLFPILVAAMKQKLYHNPSPTNHHHHDSSFVSHNDSSMPITSTTIIMEPLPVGQPLLQPWQRLMVPPSPSIPTPFYCFISPISYSLTFLSLIFSPHLPITLSLLIFPFFSHFPSLTSIRYYKRSEY